MSDHCPSDDDTARADFDRRVARVVGGLRAGRRRKAVMREELLAHLLGAYAQEADRAGPGPPAIGAAVERFGDCDRLARELQAGVPLLERIAALIVNKEHRMWRLLILGGFLVTLFGISMVLPALAKLKHVAANTGVGHPLMMLALGLSIGVAVAVVGLSLVTWGIVHRSRKTA
jgi:hypothetical protein